MDPEIFRKPVFNFRTTSNFLKDIWYPPENRNQRTVVYNEYTCTNRRRTSNYLNDFVSHRTYRSAELSSDQIQAIHENNIQHATSSGKHRENINNIPISSLEQDTFAVWSPDDLLTDSLMDKFDIVTGKGQERVQNFHLQSRILFFYLTEELGSRNIVRLRRKLLKGKFSSELIIGSIQMKIIVRGSRSEGLIMKGSDTDIMTEIGAVYQKREKNQRDMAFEYDSMSGSPGYVNVSYINKETHITVSSEMVKTATSRLLNLFMFIKSMTIHGPSLAMTDIGDDFDLVLCLRSNDWPAIAKEWIFRKRWHGWPSQEMINNFVKQGCHIVPVGNKDKHKDEVEWRLSFSKAEEELVLSFNHVQLMIYGLLKILLKEVLNQNVNTAKILCSYFMKTVMFWVIEETPESLWASKYTILCFHLCLERLIQFVKEDNCPNYFVPVNNMFARRFSQHNKEHILEILCRISASGLKWNSPSALRLERYLIDPTLVHNLKIETEKKIAHEKIEIASELTRFFRLIPLIFSAGIGKSLAAEYFKSNVGKHAGSQVCHFIDTVRYGAENKKVYLFHKLVFRLLMNTCNDDLVSGKALLASWLYNQGRYSECIQVVEHALESRKFRIIHIGPKCTHFVNPDNSVFDCSKLSYSDILGNLLNLFSTCFVPIPFKSVLMPIELAYILSFVFPFMMELSQFNATGFIFFPDSYCYFLKCMCLLSQGNIATFNEEYKKLEHVKTICSQDEEIFYTFSGLVLRYILQHQKNLKTNNDEVPTSDFNEFITLQCSLISALDSIFNNAGRFGLNMDIVREHIVSINRSSQDFNM